MNWSSRTDGGDDSRGAGKSTAAAFTSKASSILKEISVSAVETSFQARTAMDLANGAEAISYIEITMKHISIGGLDVSRIGLGAMSMAGYDNIGAGSDAESIRTIHRALDLGVTHLDTAEIYGPYTNEELVGRAIKDRRDKVVLATKFGIVSHSGGGPGVLDSSPANIRVAAEGSLKRP